MPSTDKETYKCQKQAWRLDANGCGSGSGGSQRKPTTPKKKDECLISVVVDSGSSCSGVTDGLWVVVMVAARETLQVLKSSICAQFQHLQGVIDGLLWQWQPEKAYKH